MSVEEKANGSRVGEAEGVPAPAGAWAVILGMVILAQVLVIFIQLLKM